MNAFGFIQATISHNLKDRILNLCLPAGRQGARLSLPSDCDYDTVSRGEGKVGTTRCRGEGDKMLEENYLIFSAYT